MIVISDTTALGSLFKVGKLHYLQSLFGQILIPPAVYAELRALEQSGYDIFAIKNADWIAVGYPQNLGLVASLSQELDAGESEAIALAHEQKADFLIIDEQKGRRKAESLGLRAIGLIGVLVLLKKQGIISAVKPELDELRNRAGFWLNETLYLAVLKSENEL